MEASHRILHDMATKDGASLPQILQYVGYLIKVANMEQRFQWKSGASVTNAKSLLAKSF